MQTDFPAAVKTHLIVLIHGWLLRARDLEPLRKLLQDSASFPACDVRVFSYDASRFSNRRLEDVAASFSSFVDELYSQRQYKSISFVGHSIGGLAVRRAYLDALLAGGDWADAVRKIVLIATPNRGSSYTERYFGARYFMYVITGLDQMRLIRDAFPGSAFITNLKLQWVRLFRTHEDQLQELPEARPLADIVLLLCGEDKKVAVADTLDVVQFANARPEKVEGVTHESILDIGGPDDRGFLAIQNALLSVTPQPARRTYLERTDLEVRNAVFLIHGIRTRADWTAKAEAVIKGENAGVKVIRPRYGYFQIIKFIWGPTRDAKTRWFRDQYVTAFVEHPRAIFSCVGHSNGTYILANALLEFRSICFDRVYFAGSVVPSSYPWTKILENKQVTVVRNDCAAKDLPVGFLCAGLGQLGWRKLGTSGVWGFLPRLPSVHNNAFIQIDGFDGHSSALHVDNFKTLRDFLLGEAGAGLRPPSGLRLVDEASTLTKHLGANSRWYVLLLGALVVGIAVALFLTTGFIGLAVYLGLLYWLLWHF